MRSRLLVATVGLIFAAAWQPAVAKDDPTEREKELEQMVRDLAQRVTELEKRLDQQQAPSPPPAEDVPPPGLEERMVKLEEKAQRHPNAIDWYWKEGLRFETEDGDFKFKFGGRIMVDGAIMDADNGLERRGIGDLEDAVEFRRARIYLQGNIYEDALFKIEFDFVDGDADFADVYLGLRNIPFIGNIRVGHFKETFGLENMTSSRHITFMERSTGIEAFAPGRNTGVMIFNTAFDERMTWAAGIFVGTDSFGDGEFNDDIHYTGRVTWLPWYEDDGSRLLHLGMGASLQNLEGDRQDGDHLVRYRSRPEAHLAPRFVDTNTFLGSWYAEQVILLGGEVAWVSGPLSLQGEYFQTWQSGMDGIRTDDTHFNAFYVQASYFLTGEHRKYRKNYGIFDRVKPHNNFREDGGWGAWEVAGRYSWIDLDQQNVSGGELCNWTFGLNWYLNPNMRLMFNYIFADTEEMGDANIFQMRYQIDF